jgi:hypothetical protein
VWHRPAARAFAALAVAEYTGSDRGAAISVRDLFGTEGVPSSWAGVCRAPPIAF